MQNFSVLCNKQIAGVKKFKCVCYLNCNHDVNCQSDNCAAHVCAHLYKSEQIRGGFRALLQYICIREIFPEVRQQEVGLE